MSIYVQRFSQCKKTYCDISVHYISNCAAYLAYGIRQHVSVVRCVWQPQIPDCEFSAVDGTGK